MSPYLVYEILCHGSPVKHGSLMKGCHFHYVPSIDADVLVLGLGLKHYLDHLQVACLCRQVDRCGVVVLSITTYLAQLLIF